MAKLAFLLTIDMGGIPFQPSSSRPVGLTAVQRFRTKIGRFLMPDDLFSTGCDREGLLKYLRDNASRHVRGEYTGEVGRELHAALAEAMLLLAWLTFDVAPASALAQKYAVRARELAHRGGCRLLETAVLAMMSEQARYVGLTEQAAELAAVVVTETGDGDPDCLRHVDRLGVVDWRSMLSTVWAAR
jgi:hypothetical protein